MSSHERNLVGSKGRRQAAELKGAASLCSSANWEGVIIVISSVIPCHNPPPTSGRESFGSFTIHTDGEDDWSGSRLPACILLAEMSHAHLHYTRVTRLGSFLTVTNPVTVVHDKSSSQVSTHKCPHLLSLERLFMEVVLEKVAPGSLFCPSPPLAQEDSGMNLNQ